MNIYEKLQSMRVELQSMSIKKSGKNSFAGYSYYELGDFLPHINNLLMKYKVTSLVSFRESATLTLVNAEKPEETIVFESPMESAQLKGAHPIQNLGAVETYSRRYLYMTAFEIVESDALDSTQGNGMSENGRNQGEQKPRRKSSPNLSQETKDRLNSALSSYVNMAGETMNEVCVRLQKAIGKKLGEFGEQDAKKALNLVTNWHNEYMDSLGV